MTELPRPSAGLLEGLRVLEIGPGRAAAIAGRMFLDAGAIVETLGAVAEAPVEQYLQRGKRPVSEAAMAAADLLIVEGGPAALAARGHELASLRQENGAAPVVLISPFGQTGPRADDAARTSPSSPPAAWRGC